MSKSMISNPWSLKGIDDLESAAWQALACEHNACVVAGPGAGKTEFLAQKVAYLLGTETISRHAKILAISFKKDAAENLAKRIRERCLERDVHRVDSVTFDAFTKNIVDRFRLALPAEWRPSREYDIVNFGEYQYDNFLKGMRDAMPEHAEQIEAIQARAFQHILLGQHKLSEIEPHDLNNHLCRQWLVSRRSNVDFLLLNRLSDFILRESSLIARALAMTYKHVLVDEFQDTTYSQYDFLRTLFKKLDANFTVVGDDKQRIMSWAGAMPNSFRYFTEDFGAERFELLMNYRSSPELVKIHHILARSIDPRYKSTTSGVTQKIDSQFAEIWNFQSSSNEFSYLAEWIKNDMVKRELIPSDYVLLVRQKPDEIYNLLEKEFLQRELIVCNEARRFGKFALQDLVGDELFTLLSNLFRISLESGESRAWTAASSCLQNLFSVENDDEKNVGRNRLDPLVEEHVKPHFVSFSNNMVRIDNCMDDIIDAIGKDTIRGAFRQHQLSDSFETYLESLREFFHYCTSQSASWLDFLNQIERRGQIPLLTVHKSKGLEYDTTIFMKLDDSSWWSYSPANPEGKATFFVGLSRAKQRVIFTYSKGDRGRTKISELYSLLAAAGVPEQVIN